MALTYTTTGHVTADAGKKLVVYGHAGCGKTTLAATMPQPSVIFSSESGLVALHPRTVAKVYGPGRQDIAYDIPVAPIKTIYDLEAAYNDFVASPFVSCTLDSISDISDTILSYMKLNNTNLQRAYGETQDAVIDILKKFRDIPNKHVLFAAQEGSIRLTQVITKAGPLFPGQKLGEKIPYIFDGIFRLTVAKTDDGQFYRVLQTIEDNGFIAKDRTNTLDPFEYHPHMGYLIAKMSHAVQQ